MSKKDEDQIVYVAVNPSFQDDNIVKIGMTKRTDVRKRMRELSLHTSFAFECIKAVRVSNAKKLEKALHEIMKSNDDIKFEKKEFFKPTEVQKKAILDLLGELEDVTPIKSQDNEGDGSVPLSSEETSFEFNEAFMKVKNGRKWIVKGSKICKERTKSFNTQDERRKFALSRLVDDALTNGIISDAGNEYYEVKKDWEFERAYLAAVIVSGGWCSNRPWKEVGTGKDYATWKQEIKD